MVGPWCFLDRYGPLSFSSEKAMDVAPHPHIGLQTVSWLLDGEIVHNDSLGYEATMHAGQLNLMTAGRGIAHSEETPKGNSGMLNGVQLWVALPPAEQSMPPLFDHYASLPMLDLPAASVTLIIGDLFGLRSPARTFSPIVGAEIRIHTTGTVVLPLQPGFEHALFVLEGSVSAEGMPLGGEALHYLAAGRDELSISGGKDSRILLIGGKAFDSPVLMWWNFVGQTREDIVKAREDWERHERFGEVKAYRGERLPAPELGGFAAPNPAS
jgi:quercetin 2,3-dioxygenase